MLAEPANKRSDRTVDQKNIISGENEQEHLSEVNAEEKTLDGEAIRVAWLNQIDFVFSRFGALQSLAIQLVLVSLEGEVR